MADVSIKYKDSVIAEMNANGTKTLNTSGCYCEGNVVVDYAPRSRSYDITLAKASGWVLLTTLDSDVLEHINDARLIVTLRNIDDYEYEFYSGTLYTVGNNQIGSHGTEAVYGIANRKTSETVTSTSLILAPAGNTSKENDSGMGRFVVENGKYYIKPGDGFINAGNWRLTFVW